MGPSLVVALAVGEESSIGFSDPSASVGELRVLEVALLPIEANASTATCTCRMSGSVVANSDATPMAFKRKFEKEAILTDSNLVMV